jgi:hypothetical protein
MKSKQPKVNRRRPQPILSSGAGERLTAGQAAQLTQTQAARRIAMLEAKLKLQGEPPHTL